MLHDTTNKLLQYLKLYNKQVLYQKTGYILSYFKDTLHLSDKFFEECKQAIGKSIRYLYMDITTENKVMFDKYWQLFVPQDLIIIAC